MPLAVFLMGLIGPLAVRVILSLGFSLVTYTGVTVALDALISYSRTNYNALPADVLALAGIAGVPEGLGLIFGAMTARIAVFMASSATKWVVTK